METFNSGKHVYVTYFFNFFQKVLEGFKNSLGSPTPTELEPEIY